MRIGEEIFARAQALVIAWMLAGRPSNVAADPYLNQMITHEGQLEHKPQAWWSNEERHYQIVLRRPFGDIPVDGWRDNIHEAIWSALHGRLWGACVLILHNEVFPEDFHGDV